MLSELERLSSVAESMCSHARRRGVYLIWRAQTRWTRGVLVREGRAETMSLSTSSGHGVQVATPDGRTALASRDDLREDAALGLLDRAIEVAGRAETLGVDTATLPQLEAVRDRCVPAHAGRFDGLDLAAVTRRLGELERELLGRVPGTQLRLSFRAELDAWRIFRSDGTDVLFAMPRCTIGARATGAGEQARHAVSASMFGPSPAMLDDDAVMGRFLARAERAARLSLELPDAPNHPAGSFPLVIDYALAKGLAHEAFGHASEADGFRSSILATDGKFRSGEPVGADHVSIVDEPVENDHAWQPYSANGVRRERSLIVDRGRLHEGLSDIWSAGPGGVRLTGAARAESFRSAPQPRMTNIRIEVDGALPAPGGFEEYGPEEVRDLLDSAGVLKRHPAVVYLSGYSGGQVNTSSGDFVFNCKSIYVLGRDGVRFHKPAIFTGSMFGALRAIREAFGPLELDALGYCGKWGQSVPSSGGSHYFLMLEPDPTVRLGGQ